MTAKYTIEERLVAFWAKVDKNGPIPERRPDLGPCWMWIGSRDPNGYGRFQVGDPNKIPVKPYRWIYEILKAPIPKGLEMDHLCRTPQCVNPDHLEPVTRQVNNLRGESRSAKGARQTHCIRGHLFDERNTYRYKEGNKNHRQCRACRVLRKAALRLKRRLARKEKPA